MSETVDPATQPPSGEPAEQPAPAAPMPVTEPPAEDAEAAELATLREQAQAAQERAATAELNLARNTIIRAAKLPDALGGWLRGSNTDELTADATALAEIITALITAATPPAPPASGRPPVESLRPAASSPAEPVTDTPDQIRRLVWGK